MAGVKSRAVCWLLVSGVLFFPKALRADCPADLTGDGVVNAADLALVLGAWGPCATPVPDMVQLPGGEYEMGCHNDPLGCPSDELPVHAVLVSSFSMSVYEVTNQRYADYLSSAYAQGLIEVVGGVVYKAGDSEPYCNTNSAGPDSQIHWDCSTFTVTGQDLPPDDLGNKTQHPMVMVSWYGAAAYCNWLSAEDGRQPCYDLETWTCDFAQDGFRLPTEAEWEYAARGGLHDPYYQFPWGNDLDGSKANYWQSGDPWEGLGLPRTSVVGYYDGDQIPAGVDMASGYGLYDMAGNVYEWCNDWYSSTYYQSSPYDNPQGPASAPGRVLRGGAWGNHGLVGLYLRCAVRISLTPNTQDNTYGFRVAAGT